MTPRYGGMKNGLDGACDCGRMAAYEATAVAGWLRHPSPLPSRRYAADRARTFKAVSRPSPGETAQPSSYRLIEHAFFTVIGLYFPEQFYHA